MSSSLYVFTVFAVIGGLIALIFAWVAFTERARRITREERIELSQARKAMRQIDNDITRFRDPSTDPLCDILEQTIDGYKKKELT